MSDVTESGGHGAKPGATGGPKRRSKLAEYAEMARPMSGDRSTNPSKPRLADYVEAGPAPGDRSAKSPDNPVTVGEVPPRTAKKSGAARDHVSAPAPSELVAEDPEVEARRRAFAELLAEFRQTSVLVPLGTEEGSDGEPGLLTADFGGIRFILAFSDEQALARYAQARGEYRREWTYQAVLGAKLLDVAVPAARVPCGVALDCADGMDGMVFPPVMGVVPAEVALDRDKNEGGGA